MKKFNLCTSFNYLKEMSDEFEFRNYENIEEYLKTVEGSRYYHGLYLKAVNHPIRRKMLEKVNREKSILKGDLYAYMKQNGIEIDENTFQYNLDFLVKALCIKEKNENDEVKYEITQAGKIIEYL
ncbi:MAG: hypothetical protein ACTSU4_06345 [Promethearchaeota archaeon]